MASGWLALAAATANRDFVEQRVQDALIPGSIKIKPTGGRGVRSCAYYHSTTPRIVIPKSQKVQSPEGGAHSSSR